MRKAETEWRRQQVADLNDKLLQLHALSNAIVTLTLTIVQAGEITPLAKLSLRLCEEVETHVAKLEHHLRTRSGIVIIRPATETRKEENER